MRWVVLNPNTSAAMTNAVVEQLRRCAPPGTSIEGMTACEGCAVIDSRETFLVGANAALTLFKNVPADTDAVLLACFGDPGIEALQNCSSMPVVGLAQAALQRAHASAKPFAIVTAGANWVSMLQDRAESFGLSRGLVGVYGLDGNGAALRKNAKAFRNQVFDLSVKAADAGARTLILGGAAFAGLDFEVDERLELMNALQVAADTLACEAVRSPGKP